MFRLQTPNTDFDGNEKLIVVQSMMAWSTYVQPLTPSFGCCPKVLQRFSLKPASRNTWSPASPPRSSNYYKSEQDLQLTCSHIMGYNGRGLKPRFLTPRGAEGSSFKITFSRCRSLPHLLLWLDVWQLLALALQRPVICSRRRARRVQPLCPCW